MKAIFESFAQTTLISLFFYPQLVIRGVQLLFGKSLSLRENYASRNSYTQFVEFLCKLTNKKWILTNVYAPCTTQGEMEFLY